MVKTVGLHVAVPGSYPKGATQTKSIFLGRPHLRIIIGVVGSHSIDWLARLKDNMTGWDTASVAASDPCVAARKTCHRNTDPDMYYVYDMEVKQPQKQKHKTPDYLH